jgi:hypothetical protein
LPGADSFAIPFSPPVSVPFFYGDREIGTVQFAKSTAVAVIRPFNNRLACFVLVINSLGTEGDTYAAGLAPVTKDNLIKEVNGLFINRKLGFPVVVCYLWGSFIPVWCAA